ncbi:sensory rhodopsin transducer [Modicisalibacter luteus]|uniref:Sensory rhodopsin transducer n=1 Tax=Modicisalibacter luteus TaxID=453962 RepID=A0ABV7M502_9GAMM
MAEDPFPLCASVFESSVPIVVQHSRLDSRQCELALLSTVAFPASRGVTLFGSKGGATENGGQRTGCNDC